MPVVEADDAKRSVVAAVDAQAILSVVGDNTAMNAMATEVNDKLRRAIGQV